MYILPIFGIGLSVAWYALRAEQLLRVPQPSRLQRLLAAIFIWWGIATLKDLILYIPDIDIDMLLRHVLYLDGSGAISFALLLMEVTTPGWLNTKRVILVSLPFVPFLLAYNFVHSSWLDITYNAFFVVYALTAVGISIVKGRKYARDIRNAYSNLSKVDISWMWGIIGLFTANMLTWWAISTTNDAIGDTIYYICTLICWQLTMSGINRMLNNRLPQTQEQPEAEHTTPQRKYTSALAGRLEQLMDNEQLYLNPELTLTDLVQRLGTNRTYLSDYISGELGTTFYDYINHMRIEHKAIPMMQQPDHSYTLEYIAEQSGFNSITTFRRAFKKHKGMLPSEYMQTLAEQDT